MTSVDSLFVHGLAIMPASVNAVKCLQHSPSSDHETSISMTPSCPVCPSAQGKFVFMDTISAKLRNHEDQVSSLM